MMHRDSHTIVERLNRLAGSAYRGFVLHCPVQAIGAVDALELTIRIRTAFAAIGAAVSIEAASSGGPFETLRSTALRRVHCLTLNRHPPATGYVWHRRRLVCAQLKL